MAGGADLILQGNRSLQTAHRGVTLCRGSLLCGRSVRWRHYGSVLCEWSVSHSGSNGSPLWPIEDRHLSHYEWGKYGKYGGSHAEDVESSSVNNIASSPLHQV